MRAMERRRSSSTSGDCPSNVSSALKGLLPRPYRTLLATTISTTRSPIARCLGLGDRGFWAGRVQRVASWHEFQLHPQCPPTPAHARTHSIELT